MKLSLVILAFTILTAAMALAKERGLSATHAVLWVLAVLGVVFTVTVLQL
jgi:hypothetical protein